MAHVGKRIKLVGFLVTGLLMSALLAYTFRPDHPPQEKDLLDTFYAHRAAYERLRDMLLEDRQLQRVASWGVETTESVTASKPPEGRFPLKHYNEYLALLGEAGGRAAFRGQGEFWSSAFKLIRFKPILRRSGLVPMPALARGL